MRWFFLFSLCLRLFANPFEHVVPSSAEEIASLSTDLLIDGFISPFSGQLVLSEIDLHVKGAQDLFLKRHYIPPQILGRYAEEDKLDRLLLGKTLLQLRTKGWIVLPHLWAGYNRNSPYFQLRDPQGTVLEFEIQNHRGILKTSSYGCTNLQGESASAFGDIRNIELIVEGNLIKVILPNGTCRFYLKQYSGLYRLEKEHLSNGKAIFYEYNQDQSLKKIRSSDMSGKYIYASIIRTEKDFYVASDGNKAYYTRETKQIKGKHKKKGHKRKAVYRFVVMKEAFNSFYPNKMEYNEKILLSSYDAKSYPISCSYYRNKEEIAKIQSFSTPSGIVFFSYDPPIVGQKGGSTKVVYPNGSEKIYRFSSNLLLTSIENYFEGKLYNQKLFTYDGKQHISKIEVRDANKKLLIAKHFTCDASGNPVKETLEGDFGSFSVERFFSKNRLIKEEREDGLGFEYTYLGATHLITSKAILAFGKPIRKTFYAYDEANNLIEETEEGKTIIKYLLYQKGPHLHQVKYKEELTVENELIHKTHYCYDNFGNVVQEDHYGSDGAFAYSIQRIFDEKGNLLEETNPLNQKASYQYNARGYCIKEIPFSNQLTIQREYDAKGRLVQLKENDHTTKFIYNTSDELIEEIDYLGLKTKYIYHPVHGKPVLIKKDPTILEMSYDLFGREVERKDAYGNITKTKYNSYQDPIEIIRPEGGKETFAYAANGLLIEHIDPDGLKTSYTYDSQGRFLSNQFGDYSTTYTYDAYHLLEEKDPNGFCTFYRYNLVGQKIEEEKEGRVTRFAYDPLGFLALEEKGDRFISYENDVLGRVLEKSVDGVLNTVYTYDASGNVSSILQGNPLYFFYDPHNRLIEKIDDMGAKTTISYEEGDQVLIKKIKDPRGIETIETYNAHNFLLKREIPNSLLEELTYDKALRLVSRDHLTFTYTPDGNRASMTEVNIRTTHWSYTSTDKVKTKTKPDGTTIHYEYDSQGKLVKVGDREFVYDELGRLIGGSGFARVLDPFGNILREEFSNGLWVESSYDEWDRPTKRVLSDQSFITYEYVGPFLKKVSRFDSTGSFSYAHFYDQYDSAGKILSETGLFTTTYVYDKAGRKIFYECPYFQEHLSYDQSGNLMQKGDMQYTYDSASRLTAEKDRFSASYDIHHNCVEYNLEPIAFDLLNQVKSALYDLSGNLIKSDFTFDVFDQLIFAEGVEYHYDALGRRLQKGSTSYLYIEEEEIGSFEMNICKELKIPGLTTPVAIEMNGKPYTPISDVQGTVRLLVDWETKKVAEQNDCDAFGQGLAKRIPYAYMGKRYDAETNLIYFGQRYYDPSLRRWLTPDPTGPIDHSNLYQYVFNNPFRFQDPNGESIGGYLLGIGEIFLGGTLIATGGVLEVATLGGYTIGFGFQVGAGMALIGDGLARTTIESRDMLFSNRRSFQLPTVSWKNTNPFNGPVDEEVFVGDAEGNIIPVPEECQVSGSKDGKCIQQKDKDGRQTGIRKDGKGHPPSPVHKDPRSLNPHAHVPGITNSDGTPWLKIY